MTKSDRSKTAGSKRRARGFLHAFDYVKRQHQSAVAKHGTAATLILTNWSAVVGEELAAITKPAVIEFDPKKKVSTLILLTKGAFAEEVKLSGPGILERVNATYGFKAVDVVKVTQTWKGRWFTADGHEAEEPSLELKPSNVSDKDGISELDQIELSFKALVEARSKISNKDSS